MPEIKILSLSPHSDVIEQLREIAAASSLMFADVVAGDAAGPSLQMKYTAAALPEIFRRTVERAAIREERQYLIASITKPVVAMLAVQMAAEGRFSLNEYVRDFVEGFHQGPLRTITIRHLLTHTSGLPDMLPENTQLRMRHASLEEFVIQTSRVTPDFPPGTDSQYSSMGFAVLAVILQRLTGSKLHDLLHERLFKPLKMSSSWLGLPKVSGAEMMQDVLPCELPPWQESDSDWNWNSLYWRTLGAPWGGMISTANDLGRLAAAILKQPRSGTTPEVFSDSTIRACTRNQSRHIAALSEADRVQRAWGLGWRLNWKDHSFCFSDFLPGSAVGHWGATGTMMWIDRRSSRWCVILTNQPYEDSQTVIQRMSNLIAASV
jgi:CubicO group peptidase (beta-lactamase class C family)